MKVDLCPPCGIKYNRLLKVEIITNEMNFIISNHDLNSSFPCIASAPNGTMKSDDNISSLIHSAYEPLSLNQRRKLYEFYKADFDIFDYGWDIHTLNITV